MIGIVSFFFSPVGRIAGLILVGLLVAGGLYWKIYSDGAASVRAEQDRKSLENLRNRTETNATVEKLPADDLDSELSRWMLPE